MTSSNASLPIRMLTPPGRGAIAVLQARLPQPIAHAAFAASFVTPTNRNPCEAPVGRIVFGQWNGEDVVLVRTAADVWEIHCHGGHAAVSAVQSSLARWRPETETDRQQDPPAFADRRPLESDILRTLIRTRSQRTAAHVLSQLPGTLRKTLTQLADAADDPDRFREQLQILLSWRSFSDHLTHPRRVVVLGAPNVGKSSLVNALLGYERSIVFDQPGTTRDVIEAETFVDGWPFLFCDSAGLRDQTSDELEREGMRRVADATTRCQAILLVGDITRAAEFRPPDAVLARPDIPTAMIWNKCDLQADVGPGGDVPDGEPTGGFAGHTTLRASAVRGDGVQDILDWLVTTLIPQTPAAGSPLPIGDSLSRWLTQAESTIHRNDSIAELTAELRMLLGPAEPPG